MNRCVDGLGLQDSIMGHHTGHSKVRHEVGIWRSGLGLLSSLPLLTPGAYGHSGGKQGAGSGPPLVKHSEHCSLRLLIY